MMLLETDPMHYNGHKFDFTLFGTPNTHPQRKPKRIRRKRVNLYGYTLPKKT